MKDSWSWLVDFYSGVCATRVFGWEIDSSGHLSTIFESRAWVFLGCVEDMVTHDRMNLDVAKELASGFGKSEEEHCQ